MPVSARKVTVDDYRLVVDGINDFIDELENDVDKFWDATERDKVEAWINWTTQARGQVRIGLLMADPEDDEYTAQLDRLMDDINTVEDRCSGALVLSDERKREMDKTSTPETPITQPETDSDD